MSPDQVPSTVTATVTTAAESPLERHDREVLESRQHERRLLAREVVCLVLLGVFVVVRQLWLV